MSPPNRACEELDGRPNSQVIKFQTMAPTKPARMIGTVISESSKKPPEIVFATSVERQAPTRLRKATAMTVMTTNSSVTSIPIRNGWSGVGEHLL